MSDASETLRTHPDKPAALALIERCVAACFECVKACSTCADACLGEGNVADLVNCIRLNLDCATICQAAGTVMARPSGMAWLSVQAQIAACMTACRLCGDECARHAGMHEHCRACAQACRACEDVCEEVLRMVKASYAEVGGRHHDQAPA